MRENKFKINRNHTSVKTTSFDSIQDLINWLDSTSFSPMFAERGPSSIKETDGRWAGTKTYSEARELMKTGWSEKAKELECKLHEKLNREPSQVMRQKSVYDVVGGNCSVPRYLQGVPTSMIRQVRTPVKQKTVTVNYNLSFNVSVTAAQLTENAIECLMYVKKLEDAGTRVNLNVFFVTERNHQVFAWTVPIKKTGERFSLSKMAFTLCHPSMLRRIMFGCIERDKDVTKDFLWGYGSAVRNIDTLKEIFPGTEFFS